MRTIPLTFLAGAFIAVVASAPAHAAPGDLGNNMAGEACRLNGNDIVCAGKVTTGGIHRVALGLGLTGSDAARRSAVAGAIRGLPTDGTAVGLRCDGGKSLDASTYLFSCTSGAGDAPIFAG